VITFEAPVYYQKGKAVEMLRIARPFTLIIADSGIQGSTAQAVAGVRKHWEANRQQYETWFDEIGQISQKIKGDLDDGSIVNLGVQLNRNHELLRYIGVSAARLDELVAAACDAGALGAKLSGGGLGGNIIALVNAEQAPAIAETLSSHGAVRVITATIPASRGTAS
jgi:mevalonate kinase